MTMEDFKEKIINKIKGFKGGKFNALSNFLEQYKSNDQHGTKPKPLRDKIKSTSETASQRAILHEEQSILKFVNGGKAETRWLDLELPVTFSGKSRRKCIDLIGQIDEKPFICELKFKGKSKSKGDKPEYGIFELLIYYYCILLNDKGKNLDCQKVFHFENKNKFKWANIIDEKPMLILAANKCYWSDWFKGCYKKNLFDLIETLNKELEVHIFLFQTENIDFVEQKGQKESYMPRMCINNWEEVSMQK